MMVAQGMSGNISEEKSRLFQMGRFLGTLLLIALVCPQVAFATFGANGSVTTDFGNTMDEAFSLVIQTDGKLVAAGCCSYGYQDFALARYNSNGSLDTSFGTGGKVTTPINNVNQVNSLIVQPDGKLVAAGYSMSNASGFTLVRYNHDGSLDSGFGTNGKVITAIGSVYCQARSLSIQPDGKLVAAGGMSTAVSSDGSTTDSALVRYNSNGSLDTSFGSGGIVTTPLSSNYDEAYSLIVQPDGKLVVAGYGINGDNMNAMLARYNSDGSLDTSFGSGGKVTTSFGSGSSYARSLILQSDGKLVVAGDHEADFALARYNSNGSLDTSFGSNGIVTTSIENGARGYGLIQQADGKLVETGGSNGTGQSFFTLVRYNSNGSLDTGFGSNGIVTTLVVNVGNEARALIQQPDGKLVAAGTTNDNSGDDFGLARYNSDGSLDMQADPISPTPTPTVTLTSTRTPTRTVTRTATISPTRTVSATITQTRTITRTATISPTRTVSATITRTRTITRTATISPTRTVSATITKTRTITRTATRTRTSTPTPTRSVTFTHTPTPTVTGTPTATPLPTPLNDTFNYTDDIPLSMPGRLPSGWTDYTRNWTCFAYLKYAETDGLAELSKVLGGSGYEVAKVLSAYQTVDLAQNHQVEVTVNSVPDGFIRFGVYSQDGGWSEYPLSSSISSPGTYTLDILDTGWTGIKNMGVELIADGGDSGNTATAVIDSVRIRSGDPAPTGWVDDFNRAAGLKPVSWRDDTTDASFGATLVNTGGQAVLTRTHSNTWGKALSPYWVKCNVTTYPMVEVSITSITASCSWKIGIQEAEGAYRYWNLAGSSNATGVFQFNYAAITGLSGLHALQVQLVVEGAAGQSVTVDWVRIGQSGSVHAAAAGAGSRIIKLLAATSTVTPQATLIPTQVATASPTSTPTTGIKVEEGHVTVFPNPARGKVTFAYAAPNMAKVKIDIYRLSGERVAGIEEHKDGSAQTFTTVWDAAGVAPGIYFCRLVASDAAGKELLNVKKKVALVR